MDQVKFLLNEKDIPRQWYNLAADLPTPLLPPLGPDGKPIGPEMLAPVFPMNLIEQEVSAERWIDIPEGILDILYRWRPAPLRRAVYLEKHLGTPARIYFKDESTSPPGSHKPNTAVAQAWYNKQFGIERLTTETGAGQWGSALAFACKLLDLECKVFMVRISFDQKPFRKMMMQTWGANCVASPSSETNAGRKVLEEMPDTPGSLGIAISEAIEQAVTDPSGKTRYSLGSVLNHVLLHQTIIGLEAKKQLEIAGEKLPDIVIGCAGGGSNFAGLAFPFVADKINGADIKIIPVEPTACPTIDLDLFGTGFHFSTEAHRANSSGHELNERWDYTLYYLGRIFEDEPYATNYRLGYVYYNYPDRTSHTTDSIDLQELHAIFSWPKILGIEGLVPTYCLVRLSSANSDTPVGGGAPDGTAVGFAHIFMLDYGLPVTCPVSGDMLTLNLHSEFIFNDGVSPLGTNVDHDWSNAVFGVTTNFDLGNNLTLTPGVYWQSSWDDSVNNEDEYWVSMGVGYKF